MILTKNGKEIAKEMVGVMIDEVGFNRSRLDAHYRVGKAIGNGLANREISTIQAVKQVIAVTDALLPRESENFPGWVSRINQQLPNVGARTVARGVGVIAGGLKR